MLGDFASLDVQNTYRGSDAYGLTRPGRYVVVVGVVVLRRLRLVRHWQHWVPRL
ncbi:hypothetical protein [Piscirickettsia salmonis]|uniref:hypothetical protein n=1 Tax=Piscirickettsia salmonis TaxID=1238 RepID=UPI001E561405|nr:hypothetical protein [Piscirickettsia salmonis]